ncbi:glycerol kinase [Synergistales bacterium]|nr:glycerol kinase [Synergistales bacterium]GHV50717.1 glycerol kinase [Synergistales bacterium]
MAEKKYVVAIDQGTTSSRCMVFKKDGTPVVSDQMEHAQIFPKPGWVEHDALEIWHRVEDVVKGALKKGNISTDDIASIGITNQRETTVIWEKATGKPIYNAIVWQCMRTQDFCAEWQKTPGWQQDAAGQGKVKEHTGLLISPYFSGTKIKWILDNVPGSRERAAKGELLFGNIDTWLIWNLTGGANGGVHVTDVSNASRTLLMNIKTLKWDEEMAKFLNVPIAILPAIKPSSAVYGNTIPNGPFGASIPVAGDLGDQQAALFGQACFNKGDTKNTYGTGCFMLMNIGEVPVSSKNGLLTTAGYSLDEGKCTYALEGSIAVTGSAVQWLRDNLKIVDESPDSEHFANKVDDAGGIYFVPAFSGLYAPYWDMTARGIIVGLTRYIRKEHIIRATLESICYQTRDVVEAMNKDSGVPLAELKVDGGAVKNNLLMRLQADILGAKVVRPVVNETTALGAAYAAGLAVGFWKNIDDLRANWAKDAEFTNSISDAKREEGYKGWKKAVDKSRGWVD